MLAILAEHFMETLNESPVGDRTTRILQTPIGRGQVTLKLYFADSEHEELFWVELETNVHLKDFQPFFDCRRALPFAGICDISAETTLP
jgi:hypothetical protein